MSPQFIGAVWLFIFFCLGVLFFSLSWMLSIMDKKICPICNQDEVRFETTMVTINGKEVFILVCKKCFRECEEKVDDGKQ